MNANSQNPTLIQITSNGTVIGTVTTKEFREYMNMNGFTAALVKTFNEGKAACGEPERAHEIINAA
jgi:hypothetical protein